MLGTAELSQQVPLEAPRVQGDAENNLHDFDFVVAKIEANYAGYPTKVTAENRETLVALARKQRELAGAARDDGAFSAAVTGWLAFFEDRHIWLEKTGKQTAAAAARGFPSPRAEWTEEKVRSRLDDLSSERWPIEGIWENPGRRSRIALLRDGDERIVGLRVDEKSTDHLGRVRAELERKGARCVTGTMWAEDGSSYEVTVELRGPERQLMTATGFGGWRRVYPVPTRPVPAERITELLGAPVPTAKRLSEETLYIRIPDFFPSTKPKLDTLLQGHVDELKSCKNLILDVRGNPGGWDTVYGPLVPWIYSRPMYHAAHEHRSTADNIAATETLAAAPSLTDDNRLWLRSVVAAMRTKPGEFVILGGRSFEIEMLPEVRARPARVGIMMEATASSGEQFVLAAQQSRKVVLFGRANTAGVVDFGNVRDLPLPSGRFLLRYATSRSARLPGFAVDGIGIAPDVLIPDDAEDEVEFVQAWLERRGD
jgi:hypothetical protein